MLLLFLIVLISHAVHYTGSKFAVSQCNPSNYICEGACPNLPPGARLPLGEDQIGLCLKDSRTDACVCWLRSHPTELHLQTLFKCTAVVNDTMKDIMCLPPPVCFPPDVDPGCMIMPHCPCVHYTRGSTYGRWQSAVAFIIRSSIGVVSSVPTLSPNEQTPPAENTQSDVREFSLKHLLFLLAFVIAPLLCWCMLTFFHEGKCRRKQSTPETEPMSTTRCEEVVEAESRPGSCAPVLEPPTAPPKFESPPPYREAADLGESCLLAGDCGPPPSYEDAVREVLCHRLPEPDSD